MKDGIRENGIDYVLVGDYYIPDLELPEEECTHVIICGTIRPVFFHPCSSIQPNHLYYRQEQTWQQSWGM